MHNQPREPQPYEDCQAKSIQEFGWTSQGMDWGWGQGIKSHHTQTCQGVWLQLSYSLLSHSWTTDNVRGVLPGLRRRKTGLLPSGPKSSFQMRARNQGLSVWKKVGEAHSPSCMKTSVKFPQSVMIWGAMSSAGVGPLCFLKTNVTAPVYQEILEHFMLPSADQIFKDADFIFQQDLAPAHAAKSTKSWLKWPWCWCAWLASKLTRPEPIENLWGIVKRKMRNETKKCSWAEPVYFREGLVYFSRTMENHLLQLLQQHGFVVEESGCWIGLPAVQIFHL